MLVGYPTSLVEGRHQDICGPVALQYRLESKPWSQRQTDSKRTLWPMSCDIISQAFEVDASKGLVVEGILRVRLRVWLWHKAWMSTLCHQTGHRRT